MKTILDALKWLLVNVVLTPSFIVCVMLSIIAGLTFFPWKMALSSGLLFWCLWKARALLALLGVFGAVASVGS